jgi:hypothetical protein
MGSLKAQPIININETKNFYGIGTSVRVLEDETTLLTIQQILTPQYQAKFVRSNRKIPNIGLTDAALWCELKIINTTNEDCYLELFDAAPDSITVYETTNSDSIKITNGGNYISFKNREIDANNYMFRLCGRTDTEKTYYVRIINGRGTQFSATVGTLKGVLENQHVINFCHGIYFGIMLLMVLYNLCIYFSLHDRSYLYYVIYGTIMTLMNACLTGYAFEYLWPNNPGLNRYEDLVTASLGISGIVFATNFLQTKKYYPKMHKMLFSFCGVFIICMLLVLTQHFLLASTIVEIGSLALIIFFFITAFTLLKKGYKPAKFFLYAWSILLLCVCIYILKDFDLIPYNTFTIYSLQIGSSLEAVLLSFALADKINISKKEKWKVQELHRAELLNNKLEIKQQTLQFIGREIHDNIGQKLTLAAIYAQQMEVANIDHGTTRQLKGISKILNDSLEELRDLSRSLTDTRLENYTLTQLLTLEVERINATGICKVVLELSDGVFTMNVTPKNFLLRIIQEFIQNSLKHSCCKKITVTLHHNESGLIIMVSDDGKGFDLQSIKSEGIGLNNMERRMKIIGGTLDLQSQPGVGTKLNLYIPFEILNQPIT